MSKMITTTALKPHLAPHGRVVQVGETIEVDEHRHRVLVKKGYVPRGEGDEPEPAASGPKPGITNADSSPRRETIAGSKDIPKKEKASSASSEPGRKQAEGKGE